MADNEHEEKTVRTTTETIEPQKKEVANVSRVSIYSSDFCDFILKPEILRAIDDCDFEYPFKSKSKCLVEAG